MSTNPMGGTHPIIITCPPGEPFAYVDATMGGAAPPDSVRMLIKGSTYDGQFTGGEHGLWRIPAGGAHHLARELQRRGFPVRGRDRFPESKTTPKRWECANPDCRGCITHRQADTWNGCPYCGEPHSPVASPPPAAAPHDQRTPPPPAD